jgi:hypothetical protein
VNEQAINSLERYKAKLRLSGIILKVDIKTDIVPVITDLQHTDNLPDTFKLNLKLINDGKVRLSASKATKLCKYVDLNEIDYTIQSQNTLYKIIYRGWSGDKEPLAAKLNQDKLLELEGVIKRNSKIDSKRKSANISELKSKARLITTWIEFKYMQHVMSTVKTNPKYSDIDLKRGTSITSSTIYDCFDSVEYSIMTYLFKSKQPEHESDLLGINQEITEMVKDLEELIGNLYDIFEPDLRVEYRQSDSCATTYVSPIFVKDKQELLDKIQVESTRVQNQLLMQTEGKQ